MKHAKPLNEISRKKEGLLNAKSGGTCNYFCALNY
jgi:hypothetical protein